MGAAQASDTVFAVLARARERDKKSSPEELEELRNTVKKNYEEQTDIRYGAARGWVDAIIQPHETRDVLIRLLQYVSPPMPNAPATAEMVAKALLALSQTPLVTIAAVHGAAVAGGAGLMSACDFVVAAEGTKIGYPEVRRGLVAGLVMTFLRRQIGERNMSELLLGSELISAERAKEIGLVNRVVSQENLMSEAQRFADSVLQGAPGALTQTKRLIEE